MSSVLEQIKCKVVPVLDPGFMPSSLVNRHYQALVAKSENAKAVSFALEQGDGSVFHFSTAVINQADLLDFNFKYVERMIKFALWSRGGYKVFFKGPENLFQKLKDYYTSNPLGMFDADLMGNRIYDKPFELVACDTLPAEKQTTKPLGRHTEGCRIGFDLGASDRKIAASIDGEAVFSEEIEWDPIPQNDPQWHYDKINEILKLAASHLPRVDSIGGSSAGVYVNNYVKVASLFRGVPEELFKTRVKDIFFELKKEWNDIPFEVVNDGEVTALAGSMSINDNAVLGIAMGSSEAVGYVTPDGNITSWLNELAFAPVDFQTEAHMDEWSKDIGCGAQYFSQQCVGRLIEPAGITEIDPNLGLPEKLVAVQELMKANDPRAAKIYQTIGAYLGYGVAHYADFYDIKNILLLGRVTSGQGGEIILEVAKETLKAEFPELAESIKFCTPDERMKRHGQAIAAASLPVA